MEYKSLVDLLIQGTAEGKYRVSGCIMDLESGTVAGTFEKDFDTHEEARGFTDQIKERLGLVFQDTPREQ